MTSWLFGKKQDISEALKADAENCDLIPHVKNIVGADGNSASKTDIWFLEMTNNRKGVLKIFPTIKLYKEIDTEHIGEFKTIESLLYELSVYRLITKRILDTGVCSNFVRLFAGTTACSIENMVTLLHSKTRLSIKDAQDAMVNNIFVMTDYLEDKRVSITDTPTQQLFSKNNQLEDSDYNEFMVVKNDILLGSMYHESNGLGYILTEDASKKSIKVSEWFNSLQSSVFPYNGWTVIFQIVVACYAMSSIGVTHNDLHIGNIFIETLPAPPTRVSYIIEGEYFTFYTSHKIRIFDFDRSYAKDIGDNAFLDREYYSQRNMFIPSLDICKVLSYFTESFYASRRSWSKRNFYQAIILKRALIIACAKTQLGADLLDSVWKTNPYLQLNNKNLPDTFYEDNIHSPVNIARAIGSIVAVPTREVDFQNTQNIWGILGSVLDTDGNATLPPSKPSDSDLKDAFEIHNNRVIRLFKDINTVVNVFKMAPEPRAISEIEKARAQLYPPPPSPHHPPSPSPPPSRTSSSRRQPPIIVSPEEKEAIKFLVENDSTGGSSPIGMSFSELVTRFSRIPKT